MTPITVFGETDQRALEQLKRCASAGDAVAAALMADHHVGYSQPIGGVVAYPEAISPSGVGYDIACGNKAVRTNVLFSDLTRDDVSGIMDQIVERVSFGIGRNNDEPVDHAVLDKIRDAEFPGQRTLLDIAAKQLGTVGSGNHYVDLFEGDDGYVWVGVHFGSRGFGHKTATGFLSIARGGTFFGKARDSGMDASPTLLRTDTDAGQAYITAMNLAGEYAYAGRDVVVDRVLDIMKAEATYEVHNHHNFAWRETHLGIDAWVVRKGATPAWPGQEGFVGGSMGENAVIIRGRDDVSPSAMAALHSTVHGAGRVMSRSKAAGRKKWVRGNDGVKRPKIVRPGLVDYSDVKERVASLGVELRGGGADEAPQVYKRLPDVLAAHTEQIEIVHQLRPIGVAMAGDDVYDPYKD